MKAILSVAIYLTLALTAGNARTLFVSTTGSDTYPGTLDSAFKTIPKGVSVAVAGDTIYVRGGTYALSATINLSKAGTSANRYKLYAYQQEHVLLDFSAMPIADANRGVRINGIYWHVKGINIFKAGDNGMNIGGSNNIVEFCSFFGNSDTGLQLSGGASNNQIINCDSYNNADPGHGNADGFAPKLDVGSGNSFYGCRAWQNSDDGWDGYMRPSDNVTTTLVNCWCFMNGYLANGTASSGNGNGYKMGGGDNGNADSLRHNMALTNCLAFDNRVKGFDQNNNRGSMTLLNCTAYRNGTNYQITGAIKSGSVVTVKNSVALGAYGGLGSYTIQATNSWMPQFSVTAADFQSIDTTGMRGPRQADGSLPILPFMHLASGSDLIDAGTEVGLPFNGGAPDLGCFETTGPTSVETEPSRASVFELGQNYPNPFNPTTEIKFSVEKSGRATLEVCNIIGQRVATLFDEIAASGQYHRIKFDGANFSSGVYFYRLQSGAKSDLKKFVLLK